MTRIENVRVTWLTDDTVRACATFRDWDDALTDPPDQELIYYDPTGLAYGTLTHLTMSPGTISLGRWCHDFPIPAAGPIGDWKLSWKINYVYAGGTYPIREITYFKVGDP